jgi:hypothetical protein
MSHNASDDHVKEAGSCRFVAKITKLQPVWHWVNTEEMTFRKILIDFRILRVYKLYDVYQFFLRPPASWDTQLERWQSAAIFPEKPSVGLFIYGSAFLFMVRPFLFMIRPFIGLSRPFFCHHRRKCPGSTSTVLSWSWRHFLNWRLWNSVGF